MTAIPARATSVKTGPSTYHESIVLTVAVMLSGGRFLEGTSVSEEGTRQSVVARPQSPSGASEKAA